MDGHEREWLRSILDRYEAPLTRYAARITRDVDLARDVVQEALLKLCSDGAPRDDGRVVPWLFAVCRNRALDVRRKDACMKPLTVVDTECLDAGPPPSAGIEADESAGQVVRILAGLSDNQQEVIRLRFQNGLRYRQISEVTGLSVSNVGYLIHTAIRTIRDQLGVDAEPSPESSGGKP
jgi:RNA polymerase sigma-70 factor (ECF subfamily)